MRRAVFRRAHAAILFSAGYWNQVGRMDVIRLATLVDPPAASQNEALNEVRILPDLNIGGRLDHTRCDPGKRQPVDLPHLQA